MMNEQTLEGELAAANDVVEKMRQKRDAAVDDLIVDHLVWRRSMSDEPGTKLTDAYDQSRNHALDNLMDAQFKYDEALEAWCFINDRSIARQLAEFRAQQ